MCSMRQKCYCTMQYAIVHYSTTENFLILPTCIITLGIDIAKIVCIPSSFNSIKPFYDPEVNLCTLNYIYNMYTCNSS